MSAAVRAGYKQTEVGVIPEGWSVKKIGELCTYQNGTSLERFFNRHDGLRVVSIGNYGVSGSYVENGNFIGFEHRKAVEKFILQQDDLTMSLNDKTAVGAIIGRVLLIEKSEAYVFNQRTMRLTPKYDALPVYLHHAINSDHVHSAIVGLAKPGTQIYVNTNDITDLRISVPPLAEQRAIATALSDVDALLAKLDALIAKKRDLKVAAMQQLLTGQTRLPGFSLSPKYKQTEIGMIPEDWNIRFIGEICQKITTGKLDANAMVTDGDYPFFTCAKEHYWISSYAFDTEALLVSGNGANVGYIHHYFGKFNAYQRTYVLTGFSANIHFTKLFMERNLQARLRTEVNAGNTPYIVMDTLAKMSVALPSNADEQTAIATVLTDMDAELTALEARRDKTRAIKQGMMQELLTGRIRLI